MFIKSCVFMSDRHEGGCMPISYLYNVGQNAASDWVGVTTVGIWT
ncbi:MAG: hypothetical protein AAGA01_05240 [Cyanobacteria bacterium P01_E01_bin.43]